MGLGKGKKEQSGWVAEGCASGVESALDSGIYFECDEYGFHERLEARLNDNHDTDTHRFEVVSREQGPSRAVPVCVQLKAGGSQERSVTHAH